MLGEVVVADRTDNFTVSGAVEYTVRSDESYTFSGVISGDASASITKSGAGTLTFSGDNTATSAIIVNDGTMVFSNYNLFQNLTINEGTVNLTKTYSGGPVCIPADCTITVGSSTGTKAAVLNLNALYNLNQQNKTFTIYKNGTVNLTNTQNFAWPNGGTSQLLFVGGGTMSGTGIWQQGALRDTVVRGENATATISCTRLDTYGDMNVTIEEASGVLNVRSYFTNAQSRTLTKTGAGKLVLSSSGTLQKIAVEQGTLTLQNNTLAVSEITLTDGAMLELGTDPGIGGALSVTGSGVGQQGAVQFSDTATVSSAITLAGDSTFSVAAGKTGTISGNLQGAGKTLTKTGDGTLTLPGTGDGQISLQILEGTLELTQTSNFSDITLGKGVLALDFTSDIMADTLGLSPDGTLLVNMDGLVANDTLFSSNDGMFSVFTDAANAVKLSHAMQGYFLEGVRIGNNMVFNVNPAAVPEPATWLLLLLGGLFLGRYRR
ncbi:MAG: autotransporter-associated beta strand repeat-containing protein [Planctomycetia bacterium]|nr:autotransporter-associated beta strand repeat-containing protein [Planctomycetia bacterium]